MALFLSLLARQQGDELQLLHRLGHRLHRRLALGDELRVILFLAQKQHGLGVVVQRFQLCIALNRPLSALISANTRALASVSS